MSLHGVLPEADASAQIQALIDDHPGCTILFPSGRTWVVADLVLPDGARIEVDGTVAMAGGAHPTATLFTTTEEPHANVHITGRGVLVGNLYAQNSNAHHELIRLHACSDCSVTGLRLGGNARKNPPNPLVQPQGACLHINGAERFVARDLRFHNYSEEALWCFDCHHSVITHVHTSQDAGRTAGWSGIQLKGDHNILSHIQVRNSGASGVSVDAAYSIVSDIMIDGTQFFQGLNLGHSGKVPSYSRVTNVIVRNAAQFGINVGFGTTGVQFSNVLVDGAGSHGINVSNLATGIIFSGVNLRNVKGYGIYLWGAVVSVVDADLTHVLATSKLRAGGAEAPDGEGYALGVANVLNGGQLEFRNVRLSWDYPLWSTLDTSAAYEIINDNISQYSAMRLVPLNLAAAQAMAFLTPLGAGKVRVDFVNPPTSSARVRYAID